jgi:chemotaxis protein methyltransferase CheR
VAFTFFFRDLHVLELAVRHALPLLSGRNRPRIWDAGCAMGQEPYTLAILLAEHMGYFAFNNLSIHATDLDNCDTFGGTIETGVYPAGELERIPPQFLEKYFEPASKPGHLKVVDSIRSRLVYQKHDLLSCAEIGEGFSLILCKNVLLHFQPSERVEVIKMFHRALAPGGFFATEQTQKMPPEAAGLFEQVVADGQLFRKVDAQPCG